MKNSTLRNWYAVHKWTSLICTAFLLLLCVTGLPLIYLHEINEWLDDDPPLAVLPADTPRLSLDTLVAASLGKYPGEWVTGVSPDDDEPVVFVGMKPTVNDDVPEHYHWIKFDARTGDILEESPPPQEWRMTFMGLMLRLHVDLFAELPGEMFLAVMGVLFVTATVSGVVLYGPFMKKLDFGTVRAQRSRRLRWLDLHNLLGIVTLAWVLVVGVTGIVNELSTPLFSLWRATDLRAALTAYENSPVPAELSSVQAAFDTVQRALPDNVITGLGAPDPEEGTPAHYVLWTRGASPLTSRLFTPALVDASTGELTAVVALPWYLKALELSRPLHFGDYGGLPLKIIWTVLDLITIVVLGSGLYLWLVRRRSNEARIARLIRLHAPGEPLPRA